MKKLKEPTTPLIHPMIFHPPIERPYVDDWVPTEEDMLIKTIKGYIIADMSSFYGMEGNLDLDYFNMDSKRSYNNPKLREHTVHYLNYFLKFYDREHELLSIYSTIKYMIDYVPAYNKEAFFYDICKYIIHGTLALKADYMVRDNYQLTLSYSNKKNPSLQYTDLHAMLILKISIIMNMMIPLLCHYMKKKKIKATNDFLMEIYDKLLHIDPNIDIYAKLYETAFTNVERAAKKNSVLFGKQDIRGLNITIHSINCVTNIIINIIVKYVFSSNAINLNYRS